MTKADLARAMLEDLGLIQPNASVSAEDQASLFRLIDRNKAGLSRRVWDLDLWTDDNAIPDSLIVGLVQAMRPQTARLYERPFDPMDYVAGAQELCAQLSTPYDPDTL